jgi:uncharacterized protein YegJ (DUF2314 family)
VRASAGLLIAVLSLVGTGLGEQATATKSQTYDPVVQVSAEDAAVNAAIRQARAALPQLLAALAGPAGRTGFSVKRGFPVSSRYVEYMWLNKVQVRAGRVSATLDNTPETVRGVHKGDRLSFPLAEVVDWGYVENGELHGNFTLRVFRARMTPQERAELDAQMLLPLSPKP